jgi:hypothetical protein
MYNLVEKERFHTINMMKGLERNSSSKQQSTTLVSMYAQALICRVLLGK